MTDDIRCDDCLIVIRGGMGTQCWAHTLSDENKKLLARIERLREAAYQSEIFLTSFALTYKIYGDEYKYKKFSDLALYLRAALSTDEDGK